MKAKHKAFVGACLLFVFVVFWPTSSESEKPIVTAHLPTSGLSTARRETLVTPQPMPPVATETVSSAPPEHLQPTTASHNSVLIDQTSESIETLAPPVTEQSSAPPVTEQPKTPSPVKFVRKTPRKTGSCPRYMPSLFDAAQDFPRGHTPLTSLGNGKQRSVPPDWKGSYGWAFLKYHPSWFEREWAREAPRIEKDEGTPLCDMFDNRFGNEKQQYFDQLYRMTPHPTTNKVCDHMPTATDEPLSFNASVFSSFEYEYRCLLPPCREVPPPDGPKVGSKRYSYIEPLVSILRHPKACRTDDFEMIVNKNYMIVDPWPLANVGRSVQSPPLRTLYFDAGASSWEAGPGGASQSWFFRIYEAICFRFSEFFMWEAGGADARDIFSKIPGDLRPGYRWFNIPLQVHPASWDNPLNHLLTQAKKEDVVVFKIDFDTPIVEHALIQQILENDAVAELIDELYFEHHVNTEIMRNFWGTNTSNYYHSDSLRMFNDLRERGIRAHSWV